MKTQTAGITSNFKKILKPLIIFRILNALIINSFFQPDEFWQALEPAHHQAFGYGTLTWEWKEGLRSYAFPFIFEMVYSFCKFLSLLTTGLLLYCEKLYHSALIHNQFLRQHEFFWQVFDYINYLRLTFPPEVEYYGVYYLPKISMAVIAAIGEYYTIALVYKIYLLTFAKTHKTDGNTLIKIATCLTLSNFFNGFFITRTFINSFEMCITSVSLYYWAWSKGLHEIHSRGFRVSLFLGVFICLQRPTNAIIWICLGTYVLAQLLWKKRYADLFGVFLNVLKMGLLAVLLNAAIDFYFYRELCFPPFKFIKFNVTSSLSMFYGKAPLLFHVFQSIPIINGVALPLFLYGMISNFHTENSHIFKLLRVVVVCYVAAFSLIDHKEFRFIYPLQPIFTAISSFSLFSLWKKYDLQLSSYKYLLLAACSIVAALIVGRFHESGVIEAVNMLHSIPYPTESIGFIMPCHSTPGQSHLHRKDISEVWAISCEPPLHLLHAVDAKAEISSYMDESDHLYDNIPLFMYRNFPPLFKRSLRSPDKTYAHEWPEYLVVFEHLNDEYIQKALSDSAYYEHSRFFNTLSHWDSRRSGDVIIYHNPSWK